MNSHETKENPWRLDQNLKTGHAKMIADAWLKHEKERALISKSPKQVLEMMEAQWETDMRKNMNETLVMKATFAPRGTMVKEIYTTVEHVRKEALRRGHRAGSSLSLESGWDFLQPELLGNVFVRRSLISLRLLFLVALGHLCNGCQRVLPCHPQRRAEARVLLAFALQLAQLQRAEGQHYLLENLVGSEAWREEIMKKFIEEEMAYVSFDQCRFNLRGYLGGLHKKPSRLATSSLEVAGELRDCRCRRDHLHDLVGQKSQNPQDTTLLLWQGSSFGAWKDSLRKTSARPLELQRKSRPPRMSLWRTTRSL